MLTRSMVPVSPGAPFFVQFAAAATGLGSERVKLAFDNSSGPNPVGSGLTMKSSTSKPVYLGVLGAIGNPPMLTLEMVVLDAPVPKVNWRPSPELTVGDMDAVVVSLTFMKLSRRTLLNAAFAVANFASDATFTFSAISVLWS